MYHVGPGGKANFITVGTTRYEGGGSYELPPPPPYCQMNIMKWVCGLSSEFE